MNQHVLGGLSIDVPASWSEHTNVVYGLLAANGALSPAVSVSLSPRPDGETLAATLESMLTVARASREDFHLLDRKESTFGDLPASSARYTSRVGDRVVEESVTIVALTRHGHGRTAMFSTMLPADADGELRALCERVLASVRFSDAAQSG